MNSSKPISLFVALCPIVLLLALIMLNVVGTDVDSMGGANQLALFSSAIFAAFLGFLYGIKWKEIIDGISTSFISALPAMMILLMVGLVSGSWMVSGVIPSMIYYGLDLIDARFFLPVVVAITAIVSIMTGSSWGTVATVGVAFLGIGRALGFEDGWVAGAIISGSYFGDKISPLSDTTNLAAAVAEVDVFDHIRYMLRTTTPSFLITILLSVVFTFFAVSSPNEISLPAEYQDCIRNTFVVSPWLLLIPSIVIIMIVKKIPAVLVLFIGSFIAIVTAFFVQKDYLLKLGDMSSFQNVYLLLSSILYGPTSPDTGSEMLDSLFSTGGMGGMINTIWLIISAMVFAGTMNACGFLEKITQTIINHIRSRLSTVAATVSTCILFNLTAGDQYMSILIPGKMFSASYHKSGFKSTLLSRSLEDSATVTSPLIPWNSCGATQASILHVSTFTYAPFAFFCWISPVMTIIYAFFATLSERKEKNLSTEM